MKISKKKLNKNLNLNNFSGRPDQIRSKVNQMKKISDQIN